MTKTNFIATIAVALIAGISIFVACTKDENKNVSNTVTVNNNASFEKLYYNDRMTLNEFAFSMVSDEEIEFFQQNDSLDLSSEYFAMLVAINTNDFYGDVFRARIKFKWGGDGCVSSYGLCALNSIFENDEDNATIYIYNEKCIIVPDNEENGLTADLFLPVYEDVFINDMLSVKHGIYKACYDENTQTVAIVTDIISLVE